MKTLLLATIVVLACALMQDTSRAAETLPNAGAVEAIDTKRGEISIDGRRYRLAPQAIVRSPNGDPVDIDILRHERQIRFKTATERSTGTLFVTEIHIVQVD